MKNNVLTEQDLLFIHIQNRRNYKKFLENYGTNTDIELFDNVPVQTNCYFLDNADANIKLSAIIRNPMLEKNMAMG